MSYVKAVLDSDQLLSSILAGQATQQTKVDYVMGLMEREPKDVAKLDAISSGPIFSSDYLALKALEERIQEAKDTGFADEGTGPSTVSESETARPRRNPKTLPKDVQNMSERDLLALTLQAEAGGEGYEGLLAAGAVIKNRVNSGKYGNDIKDVILKPGQFSAWNSVTGYAGGEGGLDMTRIRPSDTTYRVVDEILSNNYSSPVGGATHYYNPSVATPKWGKEAGGNWQTIGNHIFGYAK